MLRVMRTVFTWETLDLLRDRRALFFLFAVPLVAPFLGAVAGMFVLWQVARQAGEGIPIVIVNGEQLPSLVAKLENEELLQLVDAPPDVEQALQSGDLMAVLEDTFSPIVHMVSLAGDGQPAYQLDRLHKVGKVIRRSIQKRVKGRRHEGTIPWRERLDEIFGGEVPKDDQEEQVARAEKTAALEELFASRLSVLMFGCAPPAFIMRMLVEGSVVDCAATTRPQESGKPSPRSADASTTSPPALPNSMASSGRQPDRTTRPPRYPSLGRWVSSSARRPS